MRMINIIGSLLIGISLLAACARPAPAAPAPTTPPPTPEPVPAQGIAEVLIQGREFQPSVLTVGVGTKVTWTSMTGEQHTVTSTTGLFNGSLGPFDSFSYTFNERGTFEYFCEDRPMGGAIIVK